jgi:hypothetical protein
MLDTDDRGVAPQWSENAGIDTFAKNQIVCRCEDRYGTSVLSPLGVVKVALARALMRTSKNTTCISTVIRRRCNSTTLTQCCMA